MPKETVAQRKLRKQKETIAKDKAWSLQVKKNAGISADGTRFRCEITNVYLPKERLNSHHIISKASRPGLRWDEDNGLCIDAKLHIKIHGDANWHRDVYLPRMKEIVKGRPMAIFLSKFL